jgi:hypothetical protein
MRNVTIAIFNGRHNTRVRYLHAYSEVGIVDRDR